MMSAIDMKFYLSLSQGLIFKQLLHRNNFRRSCRHLDLDNLDLIGGASTTAPAPDDDYVVTFLDEAPLLAEVDGVIDPGVQVHGPVIETLL